MADVVLQEVEASPISLKNITVDLQGAVKQGMEQMKAELRAELRSGFEIAGRTWGDELVKLRAELQPGLEARGKLGDPLDDRSRFRQGLRSELQVQLRIASVGNEDYGSLSGPGTQGANGVVSMHQLEHLEVQATPWSGPGNTTHAAGEQALESDAGRNKSRAIRRATRAEARGHWRAEGVGKDEALLLSEFECMSDDALCDPFGFKAMESPPPFCPKVAAGLPATNCTRPRSPGRNVCKTEQVDKSPSAKSDMASDASFALASDSEAHSNNDAPAVAGEVVNDALAEADEVVNVGVRSRALSEGSMHAAGTLHKLAAAASWDGPDGAGYLAQLRRACAKVVHNNYYFDVVMGLAIVANSISIGLEIQWDLDDSSEKVQITRSLEHLFLVLFIVELLVRFLADGAKVRHSSWFLFDLLVVIIGSISTWVVYPILESSNGDAGATREGTNLLSQVLVVRVLRLMRLIRALRLLEQFQELWKLAHGLMTCVTTVISALLLVMITVYIFACLGIELITRNEALQEDAACTEIVDAHFRSLPITMLTLVQFANADSIAGVYMPLVSKAWYLVFYFGTVWLIVTISLMNLVTGVIVDRAISQGHMDREMEMYDKRRLLKNLTPTIQSVFRTLDDGDGQLQLSEVKAGLEKLDRVGGLPPELHDIVQGEKLVDMFEFLDADESGEVDEAEFLDGVFHLTLQTVPIETTQTLQLLREQRHQLQLIKDLACLQACQGRAVSLAKSHKPGDRTIDVEFEWPAVTISGGGRSERRALQGSTFNMSLDAPLRRAFPESSKVSPIKPKAGSVK